MSRPILGSLNERTNRVLNRFVGRSPRFARAYWSARGARHERKFWANYLETGGADWPEDHSRRLDPSATVADQVLRQQLAAVPETVVDVLDVGAGPITRMGYRLPDKSLSITPVDALADAYNELLDAQGLEPPVRTVMGTGGGLARQFGSGRFHVAYACNSIDHAPDPVRVIEQMLEVLKPGGRVVLRHARNEGERHGYRGLHQWNVDVTQAGSLVIWNRGAVHDVSQELASRAAVRAWSEEPEWVLGVLTPHGAP